MPPARKVMVRLEAGQREVLTRIVKGGKHPVAMVRRAHILLKADADGSDGWPDARIAQALCTTPMMVRRIRHQCVGEGQDARLHRKRPTVRQYRILDGPQEAKLVVIACPSPPRGRARWTMKRMADRLVELEVVALIDPATPSGVCRTLKKTRSSRRSSSRG